MRIVMKRGLWWGFFAGCLLLLAGCGDNRGAESNLGAVSSFSPSVTQGFNFQADAQAMCGYLTALTIGETTLAADLTVADPLHPGSTQQVVGVIASSYWPGGYADPLYFAACISDANRQLVSALAGTSTANTEVTFRFTIYDYDLQASTYYHCFDDDGQVLHGLLLKSGGEMALSVSATPHDEVPVPPNYPMTIGIMPAPMQQHLGLGFGVDLRFCKQWGISVGW